MRSYRQSLYLVSQPGLAVSEFTIGKVYPHAQRIAIHLPVNVSQDSISSFLELNSKASLASYQIRGSKMSSSSNAFHHQIYTLASFRHMKDHVSPSPPPPASYEESKYLKLLDDIALLLIDSERGDVAAVSIIMTSSKVYLHYAKNGPCDPSLRIYLDEIQNILVYDDVKDMSQAMILKTMNFCIRKFKSRVVNCRMELNACGIDFGVESTAASEAEQGNSFSKSMPGLCEGLNNRQAIELFIKKIKTCDATIDGLQNNLKDSIGLTCMACGIGTILILSLPSFP